MEYYSASESILETKGVMNYRLATIDDFEEIIDIYRSAIDAMNADGIMQWDEIYPTADDIRKDIDTQEMYVGLKDSQICVAYTLNKESDAQYQNASWVGGINYIVVHRLCVAPEFQHQHIARETMGHIHNECRGYGIKSVRLDAFTENPYALALYENLGYQKRGEAVWRKGKFNLYELLL